MKKSQSGKGRKVDVRAATHVLTRIKHEDEYVSLKSEYAS